MIRSSLSEFKDAFILRHLVISCSDSGVVGYLYEALLFVLNPTESEGSCDGPCFNSVFLSLLFPGLGLCIGWAGIHWTAATGPMGSFSLCWELFGAFRSREDFELRQEISILDEREKFAFELCSLGLRLHCPYPGG